MDVREFLTRLLRFVIILLAASRFATAGTTDPSTPDDKYVEFGKQFPNVVRIRAKIKCDNPECELKEHNQFGSAVIIRPHWLLTAAHVVKDTTEPTIVRKDGEFPLGLIVTHKDFADNHFGFGDLALCYSAKDFKAEFYPELYRDTDELGKAVTIAGYGLHGTFSTGAQQSDGKKRGGHNKLDSAERGVLVCTASSGLFRFPLEFMIAPGDSGGGMFIGNKLAGINSFLMAADKKPDGTYGDESAFTRVSLYTDWVESQITQYELALAAQATTGPEPSTHLDINESK